MQQPPFSKRHGYSGVRKDVSIWEEAPESLRFHVLGTAEDLGCGPSSLRSIICSILRTPPDRDNFSEYPNIQLEVERLLYKCDWFKIYDIIEVLYGRLSEVDEKRSTGNARKFEQAMNDYFIEEGVGWQLRDGQIITRGTEAFEAAVTTATLELVQSERSTAATRMDESHKALSRRPKPDLAGAISHAIAALECVAGDITGDSKATLGDFVKKDPGLSGGLKRAIEGIWGYSCNEGARHGKEGREPAREEAELVVGLAASVVTYLNRKNVKESQDRHDTKA